MIYADNAATTSLHPLAFHAMAPYLVSEYGNPSSHYTFGRTARQAIETAREQTASLINAAPEEIFFTSGGTESDNWALTAAVKRSLQNNDKPVLIHTPIEHSAIINTAAALNESQFLSALKLIPVDNKGFISPEDAASLCSDRHDNIISVMFANNEIGSIQPIEKMTASIRQNHSTNSIIHTDAVQAVGHIHIDVKKLGIDMLSASAHKFHGPKGIGFLYINKNLIPSITPLIYGGSQERSLRAGTENVAAIVGLGKAAEIAKEQMMRNRINTLRLSHTLAVGLADIPGAHINGSTELGWQRLPNNVNIRFDGIFSETLLGILDSHGICASAGSACHAGDPTPSHVLKAIGLTDEQATSSLRFTLSEDNTDEDVEAIISIIRASVDMLKGGKQ